MGGNPIRRLRQIAKIEAVSFIILLGVAMPLKYVAGFPMAVKIAGWVHGVLFVLFCAALLHTVVAARWPLPRAVITFISALLPFGPFILDQRMISFQEEFARSHTPPEP